MPSLAELTDAYSQPDNTFPVEQPYTPKENAISIRPVIDASVDARPEPRPEPGVINKIVNKLTGNSGEERYQLWPEKLIRSGFSAAGDALAGNIPQYQVDPVTGDVHTSPQMIERSLDMSAVAGTGGLAGTTDATLGATPFLRPALKYGDKIYKAPVGGQHLDALPAHLAEEFNQMAMSGEDISHYKFGFMNEKGQFLDREKALEHGINTGLIDPSAGQYGALTSTLLADSSKPGTAIEAMGKSQPFYSALEHNVNNISQSKMTGDQWLGTLANKPGVKPEELQWTGVQDFLKERGNQPVTKAELQEHLQNNKVELKEVNKFQEPSAEAQKVFDAHEKNVDTIYDRLDAQVKKEFGGTSFKLNNGDKIYSDELSHGLFSGDIKPSDVPASLQSIAKELEEGFKAREKARDDLKLSYRDTNKSKYDQWQLPGAEPNSYREMLLTLPKTVKDNVAPSPTASAKHLPEWNKLVEEDKRLRPLVDDYNRRLTGDEWNKARDDLAANNKKMDDLHNKMVEDTMKENPGKYGDPYKSSHWDEPNILAHVRMNDRTIEGKKSLHLEEGQSDWSQKGSSEGYKPSEKERLAASDQIKEIRKQQQELIKDTGGVPTGENRPKWIELEDKATELGKIASNSEGKVPNMPFKGMEKWSTLILKRMIREAAEKGKDRLSWTPGEAQAARYDLSKQVDSINVKPEHGNKLVEINPKGGKQIGIYVDEAGKVVPNSGYDVHAKPYEGKALSDIVGKETANKILKLEKGELSGEGLKIGGEFHKKLYDEVWPKILEKIGKEHGVKVKQGFVKGDHDASLNEPFESRDKAVDVLKRGGEIYAVDRTGETLIKSVDHLKQLEAEGDKFTSYVLGDKQPQQPIHYIDLPQSLKDKALSKGFPLFSSSHAGLMFVPVSHNPFNKEKK